MANKNEITEKQNTMIEHELDGHIYTPYYTEFEWAMDLSSRDAWEGLKEKARDINCVTKDDPDYCNPISFPRYTPECESSKYKIKTFKIQSDILTIGKRLTLLTY